MGGEGEDETDNTKGMIGNENGKKARTMKGGD